jgi:hypothetical protein
MDTEVAVTVELTAQDVMSEAATLLQQLSEHEAQAAEVRIQQGKSALVTLQQVTSLDMGSYLLSLVMKGHEVQAQERLDEIDRQLAQNSTLSAVERDRIFSEHVKKSAENTVKFLSSLPSNTVDDNSKRRLESIIRLKQTELQS